MPILGEGMKSMLGELTTYFGSPVSATDSAWRQSECDGSTGYVSRVLRCHAIRVPSEPAWVVADMMRAGRREGMEMEMEMGMGMGMTVVVPGALG